VDQQPKADQVQYADGGRPALSVGLPPGKEGKREQSGVDHNGRGRVQRVETDGTATGIVDRISQQMVGIDEQGRS